MRGGARRRRTLSAAGIALVCLPATAGSVSYGGADFLAANSSARLAGTSGALLAEHLGANGIFSAPSSLLNGPESAVDASYVSGLMDTAYQYVAASRPLSRERVAGIGLAYARTSDVRIVLPSGDKRPNVPVWDLSAAACLAKRLGPSLALAAGGKVFYGRLFDTGSFGAAVDLEVRARLGGDEGISALVSLRNLGYASAHVQAGATTPGTLTVAFSRTWEGERHRFALAASAVRALSWAVPLRVHAGGEVVVSKVAALRAGVESTDDGVQFAIGAGVMGKGLSLDYAVVPHALLGLSHRFSVGWRFR